MHAYIGFCIIILWLHNTGWRRAHWALHDAGSLHKASSHEEFSSNNFSGIPQCSAHEIIQTLLQHILRPFFSWTLPLPTCIIVIWCDCD